MCDGADAAFEAWMEQYNRIYPLHHVYLDRRSTLTPFDNLKWQLCRKQLKGSSLEITSKVKALKFTGRPDDLSKLETSELESVMALIVGFIPLRYFSWRETEKNNGISNTFAYVVLAGEYNYLVPV